MFVRIDYDRDNYYTMTIRLFPVSLILRRMRVSTPVWYHRHYLRLDRVLLISHRQFLHQHMVLAVVRRLLRIMLAEICTLRRIRVYRYLIVLRRRSTMFLNRQPQLLKRDEIIVIRRKR